ncbi:MAG: LbtU family siderophore porin [Acidiferrobacterales bacterium]
MALIAILPGAAHAESDSVIFSGINEFETGVLQDGNSLTTSSPAISKVELQVNSPDTRPFGALLRLKHEVDNDEVDEAYLRYRFGAKNDFAVVAGKTYSPFGQFESSLVTDPMTLTVGETHVQGLKLEQDHAGWVISLFASAELPGNGKSLPGGVGLNYSRGENWRGYGFGVAAMSNLATGDGISAALSSPGFSSKAVPALAAHATYGDGTNRIVVEAVSATERFAAGDLAFAGNGARPEAFRAEVGRRFQFLDKPMIVAASWQQSHEVLALDLPQTRISTGISTSLSRNASLALEWLHDTAYAVSVGGSGKTNDTLTLQFALTF